MAVTAHAKRTLSFCLIALCVVTSIVFSGCSMNRDPEVEFVRPPARNEQPVTAETVRSSSLSPDDPNVNAERLALNGEKLVSDHGFMFADQVFESALKLDANNARARFYRAILKAPMKLRGIYKRTRPLVRRGSFWLQTSTDWTIESLPPSGLRSFLLDADSVDINTEEKFQAWIADVRVALSETRTFLKANRGLSLRLNFTSIRDHTQYLRSCPVNQIAPGLFQITACPFAVRQQFDIDRADIEVMTQYFAGAEALAIIATAYGIEGLSAVERENNYRSPVLTDRQLIQGALSHPGFGQLKSGNRMADVPSLAADILSSLRWARSFRERLCPRPGQWQAPGRENHFFALCLPDTMADGSPMDRAFEVMAEMVMGRAQRVDLRQQFDLTFPVVKTTDLNPLRPFFEIPRSLRTLEPTAYDLCDEPTQFLDATLAGIFPRGDAGETFSLIREPCDYERQTRVRRQ